MSTERTPKAAGRTERERCEDRLEEMVEESLPGNDPPSTRAGPDEPGLSEP